MRDLLVRSPEEEESHWLSISDLMAGLMVVFLFISIALMRNAYLERDKIKQVAVAYQENQVSIYDALIAEFTDDLQRWDAEIDDETLTFTFKSPDVLFRSGESTLTEKYSRLLQDFFPRYLEVLKPFRPSIGEVRIEGHTSSIWNTSTAPRDAYFLNMALSQDRTRSVLAYVFGLSRSYADRQWIESTFAAVGLSSSKRILDPDGGENRAASRRVSFRVLTNADVQIKRILESAE